MGSLEEREPLQQRNHQKGDLTLRKTLKQKMFKKLSRPGHQMKIKKRLTLKKEKIPKVAEVVRQTREEMAKVDEAVKWTKVRMLKVEEVVKWKRDKMLKRAEAA